VKNVTFYRGAGCAHCKQTGFRGRVGIFELMELDGTLREMAFRRESHTDIRKQARISGMKTLEEDGVRKALAGITMLEEVVSITQREEEVKQISWDA
jgi:type IV pilus assembly protein PilB